MGILRRMGDCGVFPPAAGEADADADLVTDYETHANYSSVDDCDFAATELERLASLGFVKKFETLEACRS